MSLAIGEFLAPVRPRTQKNLVVAAMYFDSHYEGGDLLTSEDVRRLLRRAAIPKAREMNVARALNEAASFVDSPGEKDGLKLWRLTETGRRHVRALLELPERDPEIERDVSTLSALVRRIQDENAQSYLHEAVECLRLGALRAAVVFAWSGATRTIQERVMRSPPDVVTAALRKYEPKLRQIASIDDLQYCKESHLLLAAQELGLFDKGQRQMLEQALDLRNKCGHPGRYTPGEKKVSAFLEDLVRIVF